ncbi:hypothetical protein QTP70_028343 [Hemibagrus guttatus]|uniref:Uncharacterized protein n=1 Tax=Hemibagrus guttatus TaxID=175788 RepID=A0AAE0RKX3_9TELE|nr:hypothetical protein QTP70_028343 [Hemibagrus guttatus]
MSETLAARQVKEQIWKVHGRGVFGVLGCLDAVALPLSQVAQVTDCEVVGRFMSQEAFMSVTFWLSLSVMLS